MQSPKNERGVKLSVYKMLRRHQKGQKPGSPGEVRKAGWEVAFESYHKGLVLENREKEKVQSEQE